MSKAFTSEEVLEVAPLGRVAPRLEPGEVRYVTPEGYAQLQANLASARDERSAAQSLPESERAVVLAELEGRIAFYEATIGALTVLSAEEVPEGRVAFGVWVTVEDGDGSINTWRIVGPDEADPKRGLLSVHAPVARALIGREPGDTVEVRRPSGTSELTVVSVNMKAASPDSSSDGRLT